MQLSLSAAHYILNYLLSLYQTLTFRSHSNDAVKTGARSLAVCGIFFRSAKQPARVRPCLHVCDLPYQVCSVEMWCTSGYLWILPHLTGDLFVTFM